MKKIPEFPLIMTVAAFICFLSAFMFLIVCTILPPYGKAMLLPVPAVVLGGITLLAYHGVLSANAADVLTAILSVLFILVSIFYTLFLGIFADLEGTKDMRHYERLYHRLEDRPGVENFPEEVPESAGEILFSWNPQFLQGSENFVIQFTPSPETYVQYRETFPAISQWYGPRDEAPVYSQGEDGILYLFFWNHKHNHPEISCAVLYPDGSVTFTYERG